MRQQDPLIVGGGPAGCAAAIVLARGGASPLLLDRSEIVGDPLCGGFLSWRTIAQLHDLDLDPLVLGGHRVSRLRIFAGKRSAEALLPQAACGLSRHALDTALRHKAQKAGAVLVFDQITALEPRLARGKQRDWATDTLFLASGKHDVRGSARPRQSVDPALGIRLRLPPSAQRQALLSETIELHLFKGGYAGVVLQEGGAANICLALRKSALAEAGGAPRGLLARLAAQSPVLAERLGDDWEAARIETVGAVPYGWIARTTVAGLFRLGDQSAVIPSLAGEGIGIALASGRLAADHWLRYGPAGAAAYQQAFAEAAARPVRVARMARWLAESPLGGSLAVMAARHAPRAIHAVANLSRIAPSPALAQLARPA